MTCEPASPHPKDAGLTTCLRDSKKLVMGVTRALIDSPEQPVEPWIKSVALTIRTLLPMGLTPLLS
jgi:hypothetical protein